MNNYLVIMAGGIGSRFWPMSKSNFPKQFHDVLGVGKTLLQMTVERFENICAIENVYIVTNEDYLDLVKEQLPALKEEQILLEPSRKNTAPCIAYASYKIYAKNPEANIVVAPSDHLILKQEEFERSINLALEQSKQDDLLITLGIKPSRPDTGYGYIQFCEAEKSISSEIKKVKTFTEKPKLDMAKQFLESGDFYWNSGMFIWSAKSIIKAFETHLNDIHVLFNNGLALFNTQEEQAFIEDVYPQCKSISIDFGIMEKANNVLVLLADLGWSDLGTWGSLYEHIDLDERKNAVVGEKVLTYDCKDNIIMMPDDKLVVIEGLMDYIVVESEQTLLICKKRNEQKIKQFVNDIKANKNIGNEFI
ncbi:MAG: mannose-1-phosphate guanylyltransferase [Flavobacteriales bacterium]|nr:mannose-1-phosphate guanylyltransferase [Flavobacteriales bacterium]